MSPRLSPSPKSSQRQKPKKSANPVPSCRQLAERFLQLQRLRQKVRAVESGQKPGRRAASVSAELA
jgi:hypothetical protein